MSFAPYRPSTSFGHGPVVAIVRAQAGIAAVRRAAGSVVGAYPGHDVELFAGDTVVNDQGHCRVEWADGAPPTSLAGPVELKVGRPAIGSAHWRWMFAKLEKEAPQPEPPESFGEMGVDPFGPEAFGEGADWDLMDAMPPAPDQGVGIDAFRGW